MTDRPDHVQKTVARSLTATPGYAGQLPKVFPYRKNMALDDALHLSRSLIVRLETGMGEMPLWFSLTGHPATVDQYVTLWLSRDAADWLIEHGFVGSVDKTVKDV